MKQFAYILWVVFMVIILIRLLFNGILISTGPAGAVNDYHTGWMCGFAVGVYVANPGPLVRNQIPIEQKVLDNCPDSESAKEKILKKRREQ